MDEPKDEHVAAVSKAMERFVVSPDEDDRLGIYQDDDPSLDHLRLDANSRQAIALEAIGVLDEAGAYRPEPENVIGYVLVRPESDLPWPEILGKPWPSRGEAQRHANRYQAGVAKLVLLSEEA